MNLNLSTEISYDSKEIQEFVFDAKRTELTIPPAIESGFTHAANDSRVNNDFYSDTIPFVVEEKWALIQKNSTIGINRIQVIFGQQVDITADVWLCLQENLKPASEQKARQLFNLYDVNIHGNSIEKWITSQLDDILTEDMFTLETALRITKKSSNRIEINIEQRRLLETMFNMHSGQNAPVVINMLPEASFQLWVKEEKCSINKVGEKLLLDATEPSTSTNVREVKQGTADSVIKNEIDDALAVVIPTQCGPMSTKNHKLITLSEFPDFKLEWKKVRIKIGCAKITIEVPIIRVRISKIILYVYYSLPDNTGQTAFMIAETCAKRSALGAAVVGLVLWNIVAAAAAFESLFKRCIEREILECVHPGIMTLKEPGPWN